MLSSLNNFEVFRRLSHTSAFHQRPSSSRDCRRQSLGPTPQPSPPPPPSHVCAPLFDGVPVSPLRSTLDSTLRHPPPRPPAPRPIDEEFDEGDDDDDDGAEPHPPKTLVDLEDLGEVSSPRFPFAPPVARVGVRQKQVHRGDAEPTPAGQPHQAGLQAHRSHAIASPPDAIVGESGTLSRSM